MIRWRRNSSPGFQLSSAVDEIATDYQIEAIVERVHACVGSVSGMLFFDEV